jgi:hypothetical protein
MTVGAVNEITLDKARDEAAELLHKMRTIDPKAERRRRKQQARTLREMLEKYLEAKKKLRPTTRADYRHWARRYLGEWLDLPMREITPDMVEKHHTQIAAEVVARGRGRRQGGAENTGQALANGALRILRAVWNWAADRDDTLPLNPVRRLKGAWYEDRRRENLVKADQMPAFHQGVLGLSAARFR